MSEIITGLDSGGISTSRIIYIFCTKYIQCFKIKRKIPAIISSSIRVIVALNYYNSPNQVMPILPYQGL